MSEAKDRRQRTISDLIRSTNLGSQDELAERLAGLGFAVTQATISRDLVEIGAVKVRREGRVSYALPDQVRGSVGPGLESVFRDWVRSVETAGNLVVIKTPPGTAHVIGVALDQSQLPEVVGTICGDDTVFVACREPAAASALGDKLRQGSPGKLQ